ncbi:unnamed protein product [Cochlearia groenlandica]
MDFDRLQRRDLQFFCKRNQIPANMTNVAMAAALKSLETVEGMDEYMNQSPSMNMPSGARTAARRKTAKDETETSELVTRSCYVKGKSSLDQEYTPSARRAQVYSTRRAVRLLEESMADLSLKTKPTVPSNKEDPQQGNEIPIVIAGSQYLSYSDESLEESQVITVRDLNDSLDKQWKNDHHLDEEQMNDIESNTVAASNSIDIVEEQKASLPDESVVVDRAALTTTINIVAWNKDIEQLVSSEESNPEEEESDEWSDYDIDDVVVEESEEALVSVKKSPAQETKTILSSYEGESISENDNKNKENVVEMVNGEGKSEAKEKKKNKMMNEESLNNVSMRQLMKMAKELSIKSKQASNHNNTSD